MTEIEHPHQELRLSRLTKPVKWFAVGALTAAVLWLVLIRGYADYLAAIDPERAILLNPHQPVAAAAIASRALDQNDLEQASTRARTAAARSIFQGSALRVLGAVAERQGDGVRAERLMNAAAIASPRDTATQYWLALRALSNQDLDQALKRMDRVLRFQPETIRELFPLLGTIASNRFGARKLVPYLVSEPLWRSSFTPRFLREVNPIGAGLEFERLLAAANSPVNDLESNILTERLLSASDWGALGQRIARRSGVRPDQIRDAQFNGLGAEARFGWQIPKLRGMDIVLGAKDVQGKSSLGLYFHNRRVRLNEFRQLLILSPGNYLLQGRVRLEALETARGLAWNVVCIGAERPYSLTQTELFRGTSPWRSFSLQVEVPSIDCPAQWILLRLDARIEAEQQIKGAAWFSDLAIEPISLGSSGEPAGAED